MNMYEGLHWQPFITETLTDSVEKPVKDQQLGIAMSGGVDSTACALLLREKYQVKGFFMQLAQPDFPEQKRRVESIAKTLGIKLQVIDLRDAFKKKVLDYFSSSYCQGLTPNPCVICNKEIKFGLFLDAVIDAGMDKMVTGHYASVKLIDGLYHLYAGSDPKKDQSYFLSRLNQDQLKRVMFPLGEKIKEDIYALAEKHGFHGFRGVESQDVCFLENTTVGSYLEVHGRPNRDSGPIISTAGTLLGEHSGLYRYTIGQRRGLGVTSATPLYVVGIDNAENTLVVGSNEELFKKNINLAQLHWLDNVCPDSGQKYTVRIRYSHRGSTAAVIQEDDRRGKIIFDEPQRAITPGQFAVIYRGSELLGSGIIVS